MSEKHASVSGQSFEERRDAAKDRINALDKEKLENNPDRTEFFETVYQQADGDAAMVPWADLEPKTDLLGWLNKNAGKGRRAIDIGCGLGDNAEAMQIAGYQTTAFDFSPDAIEWAQRRFPGSKVDYHVADLSSLPRDWAGRFDLVHECYTLQSIPPETLEWSVPAVASLVAPGGTLLVYTRIREDGAAVEGPPWPLEQSVTARFAAMGFAPVAHKEFSTDRHGRLVPHIFSEWKRHA